ncbi:MAG: HAMP domain-containing histidine kinase [Deltaproteobacteria bacterium]|jgi:two-component system OmpR family sensor kinase|nr:HAMP domain-containing histidine kinase [Deltaproteobacteria bacterium]
MRIRSIGARLTIWYTSLLTLTFLLLGGIAFGLLVYSLSRDMDTALNGVADVLAQRARVEGSAVVPSDVDELFRRFFGFSPLDRHIEMFDPRGRRYPRQPPSHSSQLPLSPEALKNASQGLPTFETVESTGSYPARILTMPVIRAGRVTNLVQVGMSLENMYKTRRRFILIMAAVLPFALLLAGGGGWLLARRALKPVDRMTQAARRISGEHLDERLQETASGDELDRLAKTLNEMLSRLDDAFHQMRQFSADASHELQTPLTILKGEMEVALRSPRSPEEYQGVLESGLEEIDRISHLVEGLLLLARADAGVLRLDLRSVELKELLQEIYEQMKVVANDHSVSLQTASMEAVSIQGDREHLRRLLLNVVDNAIKYTPAGGSVTLSLQHDGEWALLKISDTGIGLSQEEQERIFSRFHRATEARSRDEKGVGLGLSIARSVAEAHGGRIQVESTPGQGSTFTVLLPQTQT